MHQLGTACRRCSSPSWVPDFTDYELGGAHQDYGRRRVPVEVMRR